MPIDSSHYFVHKSIKVQLPKNVVYEIFYMSKCELISQRVNQKEYHCSVLKSSRDQLQEYAIKNRGFH